MILGGFMVKKQNNDKTNVVIVAIVAIVAIVVLSGIFSDNNNTKVSSDGNIAGEAYYNGLPNEICVHEDGTYNVNCGGDIDGKVFKKKFIIARTKKINRTR